MFESDPDDVVLSKISANGCQTFANLVGLIGLSEKKEQINLVTHQRIYDKRQIF